MIAFRPVSKELPIICIAGPTASGKSSRAVEEALARDGEVISVDSRQVYRMLDIGTEKITADEMRGVPHHLIDIRDPGNSYGAGDFVADATRLIGEIRARGKLPILAGGTHFYFDAFVRGLPADVPENAELRERLAPLANEELLARIAESDPRRAKELDPKNRRRLIRALEIIASLGTVPPRGSTAAQNRTRLNLVEGGALEIAASLGTAPRRQSSPPRNPLPPPIPRSWTTVQDRGMGEQHGKELRGQVLRGQKLHGQEPHGRETRRAGLSLAEGHVGLVEWIVLNPPADELRKRIDARLENAFERGLIEEVRRVREHVGDARLNELGLEYRVVGEFLSASAKASEDAARLRAELMPKLSAKLHQFARRQRAWLRKLSEEVIAGAAPSSDRS